MSKAFFVSANGVSEVREFTRETEYDVIRTAVGGLIEAVSLRDYGLTLWVNESGKLNDLEFNLFGTALWASNYGLTDVIVGDILITGGTDDEGYSLGLTDEELQLLQNAFLG